MSLVALAAILTGSRPVGGQGPVEGDVEQVRWTLLYAEDFSTPLDQSGASWVWENYSRPFDTIMDDAGLWYQNGYGQDWHMYRLRVLGQWFDGIRFYAAASSPRRSRRTWAGLR